MKPLSEPMMYYDVVLHFKSRSRAQRFTSRLQDLAEEGDDSVIPAIIQDLRKLKLKPKESSNWIER